MANIETANTIFWYLIIKIGNRQIEFAYESIIFIIAE